jgi:hypothetical protein
MNKVCGASGAEKTGGTGRARGVKADGNHVFKKNAGFFGGDL